MTTLRHVILALLLLLPFVGQSQQSIQFYIYDQDTKEAISGTHVFLTNTNYGSISDEQGLALINFPAEIEQELLISHVAHDIILLSPDEYINLGDQDTIWLTPNLLLEQELNITSKRNKKWKSRYKKFKKGFLGEGKSAGKCEILNPEVLRFEEEDGTLLVTAVDLIKIDNKHLGYNIHYWLNYFVEQEDGSREYLGKAKFEEYPEEIYVEKRTKAYRAGSKHFLRSLIANTLEQDGYDVSIIKRSENEEIELTLPPLENLVVPTEDGNYQFFFPDFLKVTNNNVKIASASASGGQSINADPRMFKASNGEIKISQQPTVSYMYKLVPYLLFDQEGNILNSKDVQEYGYWAQLRMADQLPFEYFVDTKHTREPIQSSEESAVPDVAIDTVQMFADIVEAKNEEEFIQAIQQLESNWHPSLTIPLIEVTRIAERSDHVSDVHSLLQRKTGQPYDDYYDWKEWLWKDEVAYSPLYLDIKAKLYRLLDSKFERYFKNRSDQIKIRADEIVWGGVQQDGIPPLRNPKMISASEADYLDNGDVVFGIYVNGIARAYPNRILAWHEFFTDRIGDQNIAGVYCTLCGTMIAYDMAEHQLGTSGFLYRSNKLMYDRATQSLWSTIEGAPVLGPLVNQNIQLKSYPVIKTTWGRWKKQHPQTTVLDLNTGYNRNYNEGEAYKEYYSSDQLMFPVPLTDARLKNKDEVFIIRSVGYQKDPTAISINYLKKKTWLQIDIADTSIIVHADKKGGARAYQAGDVKMISFKKGVFQDEDGQSWELAPESLINKEGRSLKRLPSHNAFWFAWINAYPETKLIK